MPNNRSEPRFVVPTNNPDKPRRHEDDDFIRHIADTSINVDDDHFLIDHDEEQKRFRRRTQQVLCSRGSWRLVYDEIPIQQAAEQLGFTLDNFTADAPDRICSYCWKKARQTVAEDDAGHEAIGNVGYRLRWKQKRRARDEWYDIIVRPTATIQDLDDEVHSFSTIRGIHLRAYDAGSTDVLPDRQYNAAGNRNQTKASDLTIGDVAETLQLWKRDRVTMKCALATPSHYYGIVKDVLTDAEITTILREMDDMDETTQAFKVKSRTPGSESIKTVDAWPPSDLKYDEGTTKSSSSSSQCQENSTETDDMEPVEYIGGVGSGENTSSHDPIEEWSLTDHTDE